FKIYLWVVKSKKCFLVTVKTWQKISKSYTLFWPYFLPDLFILYIKIKKTILKIIHQGFISYTFFSPGEHVPLSELRDLLLKLHDPLSGHHVPLLELHDPLSGHHVPLLELHDPLSGHHVPLLELHDPPSGHHVPLWVLHDPLFSQSIYN